ncbi:putative AT DNA binding protein [Metarhizium anisopliae]
MNNDMAARDAALAYEPTADVDIGGNHLMSILSARKYPVPTTQDVHAKEKDNAFLQSLSFVFDVDHGTEGPAGLHGAGPAEALNCFLDGHNQPTTYRRQGQSTASPAGESTASKKRGSDDGQGPKERRKKQIREAQRAYRLRKESRISFLTKRVSELEQVIEDMSTTVTTFSDSLLQSGVLAPHAHLTQCTRETLEKCLRLARTTNVDDEGEASSSQPGNQPSAKEDPNLAIGLPGSPRYMPPLPPQPFMPQPLTPPSMEGSETVLHLQYSTFMDQLHMAILYRGYVRLTDPSVSAQGVRHAFRLLYPTMGRSNLTAYFAAALHAKISKTELAKQWKSVPFFQLGGAGTHYAWPPELGPYTRRSRHWHAISVPLSHFSSDIQKDLNGDWFDMQDLECFLMEKNVKLVAAAGAAAWSDSNTQQEQTHINAKQFISGIARFKEPNVLPETWSLICIVLLDNAVCLGRSAGFRRSDVETALAKAVLV